MASSPVSSFSVQENGHSVRCISAASLRLGENIMPTYHNLKNILNTILQNEYTGFVRALGSDQHPERLETLKSGYNEKYFNLSPYASFSGRMVSMTVSKDGRYRLAVSFSKIRDVEKELRKIMQEITGNIPEYGAYRNGEIRDDSLRCTINTESEEKALKDFLHFYDEFARIQ